MDLRQKLSDDQEVCLEVSKFFPVFLQTHVKNVMNRIIMIYVRHKKPSKRYSFVVVVITCWQNRRDFTFHHLVSWTTSSGKELKKKINTWSYHILKTRDRQREVSLIRGFLSKVCKQRMVWNSFSFCILLNFALLTLVSLLWLRFITSTSINKISLKFRFWVNWERLQEFSRNFFQHHLMIRDVLERLCSSKNHQFIDK